MDNINWEKSKTYRKNACDEKIISFKYDRIIKLKTLLKIANDYLITNFLRLNQEIVNLKHGSLLDTEHDSRGRIWIEHGVDAEILEPKSGWKKGKIRLRVVLEFCPDEEENKTDVSLDDIRQDI